MPGNVESGAEAVGAKTTNGGACVERPRSRERRDRAGSVEWVAAAADGAGSELEAPRLDVERGHEIGTVGAVDGVDKQRGFVTGVEWAATGGADGECC